ncbi:MAG: hypothetical protein Q4C13_05385, partial [Clostridia bacterium]|nr:hypothetical protein [Clostridia bacterium]
MTSLETKSVQRYLRRGAAGGRGLLARALDYILLRTMLFFGALLFFRQRLGGGAYAWLLAALTLLLGMVLLRIAREIRFENHARR